MSARQAVIYGSNGGIGSAIVNKFFKNKYNLCLFSRNESKLKANIDRLNEQVESNQRIIGCAVDVCDTSSIELSIEHLQKNRFSPISDLILCAGVNKDQLLIKETYSNIDHIIQTNFISSLNLCKQYSKLMIRQNQESSIVLIGSVVGLTGNIGQSIYASSKSALVGLIKSLSKELYKKNIRVNLVVPGFVDTIMLNGLDKEKLIQNIPLGRLGNSEDVANAVYFISTNKSINGQQIVVDGGLSLR